WDRQRDPVWPRLQKVFALYGAEEGLAAAQGKGNLRGSPPDSTHCNNVGPYHRSQMYPALKRWLDFPVPQQDLQGQRRPAGELASLTPELVKELRPRPVYELAAELGQERSTAARAHLARLRPQERRQWLRREWGSLLGEGGPRGDPKTTVSGKERL